MWRVASGRFATPVAQQPELPDYACSCLVVLDQAKRLARRDALSAAQAAKLDQERASSHDRSSPLDELAACVDGAAGGQKVVNHQHTLSGRDAIGVDLERVGAILKVVAQRVLRVRQLARLANRHKADA